MASGSVAQKDAILKQAYTELVKADRGGDYERALKASNRILKTHPQEAVAFQSKVACLIHLSKFEETLQLLKKTPPNLTRGLHFEKAYSEYRLNRTDDAERTLKGVEELDFRCQELKAQLLYRQERFAECRQIYLSLLKESDDNYDQERRANLFAVDAQLAEQMMAQGQKPTLSLPEEESYEQHYNNASSLIAVGEYKKAIQHLDTAEKMCRETLAEDEVPEDEIEEEVALIKTQQAFCKQMLGDVEAALADYNNILKQKPSDAVVLAVASNNAISARRDQNLFDARKKLKTCQSSAVEQKLTTRQKRAVCLNSALVQLHSNQYEPCRRLLTELRSKYGAEEEAILIEMSLLLRQKETQKAIDLLSAYRAEQESTCAESINLALAQLYLNDGKWPEGVEILNSLERLRWTPGILSLLVSVKLANDQSGKSAMELMDLAVNYYRENMQSSKHTPVLLEQCASLHNKFGNYKKACQYLEDLRKLKPNDGQILARLIQIYSQFDSKKAEEISQSMPPLGFDGEFNETDIDNLESSEWILLGERYRQKKEAKQTPKPESVTLKTKKKKKRKPKLPKNCDPSVPVDPERWMPKYERSTYKRRKDKRAKDRDIGRGTQGAVGGTNAELESPKPTVEQNPTSPKPAQAAPGPRQQRPGGQQKAKKKKKGGPKW